MKKKVLLLTIIFVLSIFGVANAANFKDVKTSHWAYKDIKAISDAGLMKGRPGNVFAPDDNITVAEFWTVVTRILDTQYENKVLAGDLGNTRLYLEQPIMTHWSIAEYTKMVRYLCARELGGDSTSYGFSLIAHNGVRYIKSPGLDESLVKLFIKGNSCADVSDGGVVQAYKGNITRECAAAMIGFFFKDDSMTSSKDVLKAEDWSKVASELKPYINEAVERGLFVGEKAGLFKNKINVNPKDTLTRAEAAALLNRMLVNIHAME